MSHWILQKHHKNLTHLVKHDPRLKMTMHVMQKCLTRFQPWNALHYSSFVTVPSSQNESFQVVAVDLLDAKTRNYPGIKIGLQPVLWSLPEEKGINHPFMWWFAFWPAKSKTCTFCAALLLFQKHLFLPYGVCTSSSHTIVKLSACGDSSETDTSCLTSSTFHLLSLLRSVFS